MKNKANIAIDVQKLSVRYKNGHTAIKNATFSISKGSISGLVGINGAGKSTIFKALMGFYLLLKARFQFLAVPLTRRSNLVSLPMYLSQRRSTGRFQFWLKMSL